MAKRNGDGDIAKQAHATAKDHRRALQPDNINQPHRKKRPGERPATAEVYRPFGRMFELSEQFSVALTMQRDRAVI